jgi:hypothetical protein
MAFAFDAWGWYAGAVPDGTARSVDVAPDNTSTAGTEGELRANWSGTAWVERPYTAPGAAPITSPVPQTVTRRQAKAALILAGKVDAVEAALAAIPDPLARSLAQNEWDESLQFERQRPLLVQLAAAIGLTDADLDELFRAAAAQP